MPRGAGWRVMRIQGKPMRIFVTGANGWIGSAVTRELIANGHQVVGLVRSDTGAAAVAAQGAKVLHGTLSDLPILREGVSRADGVVHTAFDFDVTRFRECCDEDACAIQAMGDMLRGTDRPLIATAGFALGIDRTATEDDRAPPVGESFPRATEATIDALADSGVHAATIRVAPLVHGDGEGHTFIPIFAGIARQSGVSAYLDDGSNLWSAVHRADAARVYRLALETGVTERRYHAVAEESVPFKLFAQAIGDSLGVPVVSKPAEKAQAHFGSAAMFAGLNMPASSARTRDVLGWTPAGADVLTSIAQYCNRR
jgi:nucleoside-diphosphate-sugar epimerase